MSCFLRNNPIINYRNVTRSVLSGQANLVEEDDAGVVVGLQEAMFCCQANSVQTRQSGPDSGPGFGAKVHKIFQGVPSASPVEHDHSLESGQANLVEEDDAGVIADGSLLTNHC